MHARLIKYHVSFGKADDFLALYKAEVLPALQKQDGFLEVSFGVNTAHNKVITLVVFDSEENTLKSEQTGYLAEQMSKAMPLLDYPPVVEHYDLPLREQAG